MSRIFYFLNVTDSYLIKLNNKFIIKSYIYKLNKMCGFVIVQIGNFKTLSIRSCVRTKMGGDWLDFGFLFFFSFQHWRRHAERKNRTYANRETIFKYIFFLSTAAPSSKNWEVFQSLSRANLSLFFALLL